MPFDALFRLGPFTVSQEGRLSPCEPDKTPAFLFRWHDRIVHARLAQASPRDGRLVLQSTLGRVPSSATVSDATLRPRSFNLLHWLPRSLPRGWRVLLLSDHCVWLEAETQIALPITAAALIAEITRFLLILGPFLDLLDEEGLPGPDAGRSRQS
jgi:hypothetical protein